MSDSLSDPATSRRADGGSASPWDSVKSSDDHGARKRRRQRLDWREGGRSLRPWDATVLAIVLAGVGAGLIGAYFAARISVPWAPFASTIALWLGLLAAISFALARAQPAGLFRFRSIDLLWGIGLGLGLRLVQGLLSGSHATAFPSMTPSEGFPEHAWWIATVLSAGLFAPLIEETMFRGVLLVAVYGLLFRGLGGFAASVTAVLCSAGSFVLLHAAFTELALASGVQLFIVGTTCALIVIFTGRLAGAVLAHIVYNVTFLVLAVLGTALGSVS